MSGPVSIEVRDGLAVVTIDNPPVNAVSQAVRAGLVEAAATIAADPAIAGAVIACAGRTFVAGADITEFGKPPRPPSLAEAFAAIEALDKPVCAVLHGTTLGGGLELALACHLRVIDPAGSAGLPEVTLGLIPGAGGTQRLPRLVGPPAALDLIATGRPIRADEALRIGLVDAVATGDRLAFALSVLRARIGAPPRRLSALPCPTAEADSLQSIRAAVAKLKPGEIAPGRAIDVVARSGGLAFAAGMSLEAETFAALRAGPQSLALRHVFFAERAVAKVPGLADAEAAPLRRIGVVGGGTMGAGIVVALLLAGLSVILVERDAAALGTGRARIDGILGESVRRGKLEPERRAAMLADHLTGTTEWTALRDADLVIEAVFEDMATKQAVFQALRDVVGPDTVLATNTSYLDVEALAGVTAHPASMIGLHFFAPAHIMKLLEVVVPATAGPRAVATGFALARRLGKIAVRSGDREGFIGNRILSSYRKAAEYMVLDGTSPWAVDAAMRAFGFPLGVFEMQDLAGLDIGRATRQRLAPSRDPRERVSRVADRLCETGRLGRKTGRGFYAYDSGTATADPAIDVIVDEERRAAGIIPRTFSAAEVQHRIVTAAINEGAGLLGEGIALRASDIDVVMIHGYGFPRWRGGPMHMADAAGAAAVLAEVRAFAAEDAWFWRPAPLLVQLAGSGGRFADHAL